MLPFFASLLSFAVTDKRIWLKALFPLVRACYSVATITSSRYSSHYKIWLGYGQPTWNFKCSSQILIRATHCYLSMSFMLPAGQIGKPHKLAHSTLAACTELPHDRHMTIAHYTFCAQSLDKQSFSSIFYEHRKHASWLHLSRFYSKSIYHGWTYGVFFGLMMALLVILKKAT